MNESHSLERSRSLLDIAVRNFVPKCPVKYQTLLPFRDHIESLRAKRASYRIIAALLRSAEVEVSHETVARFCREVIGKETARHNRRKPSRNGHHGKANQPKSEPTTQPASTAASQSGTPIATLIHQHRAAGPSTSMPLKRTKGPRIADPKNV